MLRSEGGTGEFSASGEPLSFVPYRGTREARQLLGVTGEQYEAMHALPRSVGESIPGYNSMDALSMLEEKPIHRIADQDWISQCKELAKADETTSARDVYTTIADSFQQSPQSQGVKDSLKLDLQNEMAELGIDSAEEMAPYRPRSTPELPLVIEELDFGKPPPTFYIGIASRH